MQLDAQNGGLERVKTAVGAKEFVEIFRFAAVHPQHAEAFLKSGIVRGDETAIAGSAKILRGEKAEATEVADGADEAVVVLGPDSLRGIFDDKKVVRFGELQNRVHVRGEAEEMDGHDGAGLRGNRGFDFLWVNVESQGINIDKDGLGADVSNGPSGGDEAEGCGDDFLTGADLCGKKRKDQSVGARGAADSVLGIEFGGNFLFQFFDFRAKDEILRVHDTRNRGHDFITNRSELRTKVEEVEEGLYWSEFLSVGRRRSHG